MKNDPIAEVAIDDQGRLLIFPTANKYPMIYREAVEVHWDEKVKCLYSPKPREWSYFEWFKHVVSTVGDLTITADTKWSNIPQELRRNAENWMKDRK